MTERTLETPEEILREMLRFLSGDILHPVPESQLSSIAASLDQGAFQEAFYELINVIVAEPKRLTPYVLKLTNNAGQKLDAQSASWKQRLSTVEEAMVARQKAFDKLMRDLEQKVRTVLSELSVKLPAAYSEEVEHYLAHNEQELAFQEIMLAIVDADLPVTREDIRKIVDTAHEMTPTPEAIRATFPLLDDLRGRFA